MKQSAKFLVGAALAVCLSVFVSSTVAETARSASAGLRHNLQVVRYHGGGYHGGGRYGGGWGWGWGWRGWYPYWGFSYVYAPSPYYYNYNGYYYYPPTAYYPPTTYYAPPAVDNSQPTVDYNSPPPAPAPEYPQEPVVDRPLSPTAVDRDSPPPPPRAQRPPQIQRNDQGQSISVADVKALANAGLSDEVILSHIRNSEAVYHLTAAEIIDLKNSGVSEKVIDFMINTASAHR